MPGYGTRTEEVVWYCYFHSGGNVLSPRKVRKHLFLEHIIKKLIFFCFSYFINAVYASCFREDEMQELNRTTNSRMGWLSFLSLFVCLSVAGLRFAQKDMSMNWESKFVLKFLSIKRLLLFSCLCGPLMNWIISPRSSLLDYGLCPPFVFYFCWLSRSLFSF